MAKTTQTIVFFHPDLGIGGAERLIIDAAAGLQQLGHRVTIFTSHCDPAHCFDEARDGTLDVRVRGNSLVPPSVLGRFAILCAILRQLHLILQISLWSSELQQLRPDAFVVDQLSAGIPMLRYIYPAARILFYCHFPDKLLAQRGSILKDLYRVPFDILESWSTGCSDGIVVNSQFTKSVFHKVFPRLRCWEPQVIYPCVETQGSGDEPTQEDGDKVLWKEKRYLLSINRFERKKDVGLAIRAFADLPLEVRDKTRLVVAGGYDHRVMENVDYHHELEALAEALGLVHTTARNAASALAIPPEISVLFLLSVPSVFKTTLLSHAELLVYTPLNEHFGIVPLEAMLAKTPVLAANQGGPLETVVDGNTGWLRDVNKIHDWTKVMLDVLVGSIGVAELQQIGQNGRQRVISTFSKSQMARRFHDELVSLHRANDTQARSLATVGLSILLAVIVAVCGIAITLR